MSIFRRRLMMISERYIMGIDFSKQPDDEIWYITEDGEKFAKPDNSEFYIGGWGRQKGLKVVSHTYENGLGRIKYNKVLESLGERIFNREYDIKKPALLISLPRFLYQIKAWCFSDQINYPVKHLIILNYFLKDSVLPYDKAIQPAVTNLYVMPERIKYYLGSGGENQTNINIIEKHLRDLEYIKFKDPEVEKVCIEKWGSGNKFSVEETKNLRRLDQEFTSNSNIAEFKELKYFNSLAEIDQRAFAWCPNLKEVWIPENVERIESWFSLSSPKLSTIVFLCKNPPQIHDSFMYVDTAYNYVEGLKIFVPDESIEIYKDRWKDIKGNADVKLISFIYPFSEYKE